MVDVDTIKQAELIDAALRDAAFVHIRVKLQTQHRLYSQNI